MFKDFFFWEVITQVPAGEDMVWDESTVKSGQERSQKQNEEASA